MLKLKYLIATLFVRYAGDDVLDFSLVMVHELRERLDQRVAPGSAERVDLIRRLHAVLDKEPDDRDARRLYMLLE